MGPGPGHGPGPGRRPGPVGSPLSTVTNWQFKRPGTVRFNPSPGPAATDGLGVTGGDS